MSQNAAPGWPEVTPDLAELIRAAAQIALDQPAEWLAELHEASLRGERMRPVAEDPALADAVRRTSLANVRHWAIANVQHPGRRVPANTGEAVLSAARDLVRRGLDETSADAYRTTYPVVWNRCMEICFALTSDQEQLRALLELASLSISTFIEDTVAAITQRMRAERTELTRGTHAERRSTVSLLLEGAPIPRGRAEAALGYRLTGLHTACVVWSTTPDAAEQLEDTAELLMRVADVGLRLTVVASASSLWVWLPTGAGVGVAALADELPEGVRVAVGRPGTDLDGFRRSHLDALATQRMLVRITSRRRVARFEDVQLVAVLTSDPVLADEFVADTLGELAGADADVLDAVRTYLREQGSTTRTAARLYTHRNTVVRRLARADELLPRPLAQNPIGVGAALEVLYWSR